MGLFSGLEKYNIHGLGSSISKGLFSNEKEKEKEDPEQKKEAVEEDYLFLKEYFCPVCEAKIKHPVLRTGKAKFLSSDIDLRPKYEFVEPLKYDIICCPSCGHTTLSRYFSKATSYERKFITNEVTSKFRPTTFITATIYTNEEALLLYKLGLACAIVKKAHASEKAYLALKAGWLIRTIIESSGKEDVSELKQEEKMFLSSAREGFLIARETEMYPIAGMDEYTLDYLIAALSFEIGDITTSAKLTAELLTSTKTPTRIKNKTRELKDVMQNAIKKTN